MFGDHGSWVEQAPLVHGRGWRLDRQCPFWNSYFCMLVLRCGKWGTRGWSIGEVRWRWGTWDEFSTWGALQMFLTFKNLCADLWENDYDSCRQLFLSLYNLDSLMKSKPTSNYASVPVPGYLKWRNLIEDEATKSRTQSSNDRQLLSSPPTPPTFGAKR